MNFALSWDLLLSVNVLHCLSRFIIVSGSVHLFVSLSVYHYQSICLSVSIHKFCFLLRFAFDCQCLTLPVLIYHCLSDCLLACLSVILSVCLSVCLSCMNSWILLSYVNHFCLSMSDCLGQFIIVCLSVCWSVFLSVHLTICLSVHLSVWIHESCMEKKVYCCW